MKQTLIALIALALFASAAPAVMVEVQITGEMEYSGINSGPFADAQPGDPANITFMVDSDLFIDSDQFNLRAYEIDQSSYEFTFGPATAGLQAPYPGTPYFIIEDGAPVEDAFYFSTWDINWPGDLFLTETGILGQFANHFELGYTEDTLSSIDILDAAGTYDYTGLTRFWYVLMDDWAEAAGLLFTQMTITPVTTATDDTSWSRVKSLY